MIESKDNNTKVNRLLINEDPIQKGDIVLIFVLPCAVVVISNLICPVCVAIYGINIQINGYMYIYIIQ